MTAAPPLTPDDWPAPWSAEELAELAQELETHAPWSAEELAELAQELEAMMQELGGP